MKPNLKGISRTEVWYFCIASMVEQLHHHHVWLVSASSQRLENHEPNPVCAVIKRLIFMMCSVTAKPIVCGVESVTAFLVMKDETP